MLILFFFIFAPFSQQIDLYVSGLFYSPENGFVDSLFFRILFNYGEMFGIATGALAFFVFCLSFLWKRLIKWRKGTLTMVLTLVLGAGIITNLGFKGHWGRPRPKQVVEFGGKHAYRPFWRPDFQKKNEPKKSFPSGHVAMGFYFLSLCLVGKRYSSKKIYLVGIFLSAFLGGGLMVGRVVQGGHFVSDVLAASLIMWYVAKFSDFATWEGWEKLALRLKRRGTSQGQDAV
jgi:lipid A 4'-phosphatase